MNVAMFRKNTSKRRTVFLRSRLTQVLLNDKEEYITFSGSFSGRRIDIQFTYDNIVAIYAKELKDFGIVVPYTPPKQVEQEQEPERAKPVLQVVK